MKLSEKSVLVTGAGGFIGSHLVETLVNHGARVKALTHYNSFNHWGHLESIDKNVKKQIEIISGDILDYQYVKSIMSDVDVVYHLAALISIPFSYKAPLLFYKVNVEGTINVLQACLEQEVGKVVVTSTSEAYGTALYTPIDEEHPLQAQSPYSASKISADKATQSFILSYALPATIIRPFNTFGPRQSARAIIPTIVSQALSGSNLNLGLVTPIRDMNYVLDTTDGFIKIAESEKSIGETINIGSGVGHTIQDIIDEIQNQLGKKLTVQQDNTRLRPENSEVFELVCNNKKAKKLLGWESKHSISDGIRHTLEYIKNNLESYKNEIYTI